MPLDDVNFLLSCLLSSGQSANKINWTQVAQVNGYDNYGSARNRFSRLRKNYEATAAKKAQLGDADVKPPVLPKTPTKKRVRNEEDGVDETPRKRGRKPKVNVKMEKEANGVFDGLKQVEYGDEEE